MLIPIILASSCYYESSNLIKVYVKQEVNSTCKHLTQELVKSINLHDSGSFKLIWI